MVYGQPIEGVPRGQAAHAWTPLSMSGTVTRSSADAGLSLRPPWTPVPRRAGDAIVRAMSAEQKTEVQWTPPQWLIPWITRLAVWLYEKTNGLIGARQAGMDHVLLYSIGRRSGRAQTVCLPYWLDPQGQRIVVASFAGGPRNPAWYHNLTDRCANPDVGVRDGRRVFRATAEVLAGAERERIWRLLVADRPFYARYQARTARIIPLVRLIEKEDIAHERAG